MLKEEKSEKETWPVGHVDQTLPHEWIGQMKLKMCVNDSPWQGLSPMMPKNGVRYLTDPVYPGLSPKTSITY